MTSAVRHFGKKIKEVLNLNLKRFVFLMVYLGLWVLVVEVGAELTGGGGGGPICIKIGYSSREPRRVPRPCIEIGYSSAMY